MKKISHYSTIHEFWNGLRLAIPASLPFEPVPRRFYQKQLVARDNEIIARIIRRNYIGPTCLRVSVAQPGTPQRQVTKLDFASRFVAEAGADQTVGHLVLPPEPGQRPCGIDVVYIPELPPLARPALDVLDRGVQLLVHKALGELWSVGGSPSVGSAR